MDETMDRLPGGALVREGLTDFHAGRVSPALMARAADPEAAEHELQLYRLLRAQGGDAYSRYNSLLRELVSFEQALDRLGGTLPASTARS